MGENSRIRFNPVTKEIEIEGSEKFIDAYFHKIQEILSGTPAMKVTGPAPIAARPAERARKGRRREVLPLRKVKHFDAVEPGAKTPRTTLFDKVVGIIQDGKGVTTSDLKKKTGLTEKQIWSITYRGEKLGKIKKSKRGVYEAAG